MFNNQQLLRTPDLQQLPREVNFYGIFKAISGIRYCYGLRSSTLAAAASLGVCIQRKIFLFVYLKAYEHSLPNTFFEIVEII